MSKLIGLFCGLVMFLGWLPVTQAQPTYVTPAEPDFISKLDFSPLETRHGSMLQTVYTRAPLIGKELFHGCQKIIGENIGVVIKIEWNWLCFRVACGQFLVDEIVLLVTKTILIWLFIYNALPQRLLIEARKEMTAGGREFGNALLYNVLGDTAANEWHLVREQDTEVPQWWQKWLYRSEKTSYLSKDEASLFSRKQIFTRIFPLEKDQDRKQRFQEAMAAQSKEAAENLKPARERATALDIAATAMAASSIGQIVAQVLNVSIISGTAILASQLAILGTRGITEGIFWMLLAIGTVVIPFMFHNLYAKVWINYIHALTATILVPPLFYLCSAGSLLLTDAFFEGMFPVPESTRMFTPTQNMMMGVFDNLQNSQAINSAIESYTQVGAESTAPEPWWKFWNSSPDFAKNFSSTIKGALSYGMVVSGYWHAYFVGAMVVMSFVTFGALLASATAAAAAYSWNRCFEDLYRAGFSAVEGGFMRIGNQISSGAASVAGAAINRLGQIGNELMGGGK
ncbi:MAG: hypothetical protein LBK60_06520 [Verrucomicrobiales bacterium]|nr:hypothetical protein [Verrucomicrobiales bacterium]